MSDTDTSLEQLLSKAAPRPVPDEAQTAVIKEQLRGEWRSLSGKRHSRRKVVRYAIAASVLISVFSLFNLLRTPVIEIVQVATVEKSFGQIFLIGDESLVTPANSIDAINVGQKIATGDNAGIALAWISGGSLRLDESTTVEFQGDNSVLLHSGRVYFDSTPSTLNSNAANALPGSFKIETAMGSVTHVGTQFMTEIVAGELTVSVREGQAAVATGLYPETADRGEQLVYAGRQRPLRLSIAEYGAEWDWIGKTSPSVSVDGKTIDEFLSWVGRELGRDISYEDEQIKDDAYKHLLLGTVDEEPAVALGMRMKTAGFNWHYEEGQIHVSYSH